MIKDEKGRSGTHRPRQIQNVKTEMGLGGILMLQTDHLTGGGTGPQFQKALEALRERFAFGKRETQDARECNGRSIRQLADFTFEASMPNQVNK
eukprot:4350616-Amphidinium_carterae.2